MDEISRLVRRAPTHVIDSIFNTPFLQDACATAEALAAFGCVVLLVSAVDLVALAITRKLFP